jgi:NAD(P)-dependent dehydrogenase (short-subunit alcohol dehydrogenase family)
MGNLRYDFTGRTAIVTGAARGIGLELGRMFHTAGAEVFLIDFDEEELAKANADVRHRHRSPPGRRAVDLSSAGSAAGIPRRISRIGVVGASRHNTVAKIRPQLTRSA